MEFEDRYQIFYQHLNEVKDKISPSDFRFYNIAHFPLLAKKSIQFSDKCRICKENFHYLEVIVNTLPASLEKEYRARKNFETQKNNIEEHLKKEHRQRFPGYYAALFSLIGILIGITPPTIHALMYENPVINKYFLIGLAVGLAVGRGIGVLIDRNFFLKNMQL